MLPNPQAPADLVIFNEEILNGNLQFLCSDNMKSVIFEIKTTDVKSLKF